MENFRDELEDLINSHSKETRQSDKNSARMKSGVFDPFQWSEFEQFHRWAMANGYSDQLTLDRIDNNGGYCPENCRWATVSEQMANRRKYGALESFTDDELTAEVQRRGLSK